MKKTLQALTKDSFIYGFGSVIQQGLAFLLVPLYTRFLDPENYGIVAIAASISAFLVIIFDLSLRAALAKQYYDYKDNRVELNKFVSSIFIFVLFFGFFLALFLSSQIGQIIFNLLLPDISFNKYIILVIWQAFFIAIIHLYQNLLRAEQKPKKYVIIQLTQFLLNTSFVIYFIVFLNQGAEGQIKGFLIANFLTAIATIYAFIKRFGIYFSSSYLKKALFFSLPIVVHLLSGWTLSKIDRIILGNLRDSTTVGIYDLGYKIALVIGIVTSAINYAWTPIFYETATNDKNAKQVFSDIFNVYLFSISFLVLAVSLFGSNIVKLIAPINYHSAHQVIPFIALGYLLQGIYFMRVTPIFFKEKTKILAFITPLSGGINILLNYLFIKNFGMLGSAYAFILSFLFQVVLIHYVSQKIYLINYETKKIVLFLTILSIGVISSTFIKTDRLFISIFINSLILAIFAGFGLLIGIIKPSQIKKTYLLIKNKRK